MKSDIAELIQDSNRGSENTTKAACYTRMLLKPMQDRRASGDDLRNYYYMLRLPEAWIRFNVMGCPGIPELVCEYGGDPNVPHRLAFRVLGMGGKNCCAIAQATHLGILSSCGVLEPETTLICGNPTISASLWQGIYLDDLLITSRAEAGAVVSLDSTFTPLACSGDGHGCAESAEGRGGLQ